MSSSRRGHTQQHRSSASTGSHCFSNRLTRTHQPLHHQVLQTLLPKRAHSHPENVRSNSILSGTGTLPKNGHSTGSRNPKVGVAGCPSVLRMHCIGRSHCLLNGSDFSRPRRRRLLRSSLRSAEASRRPCRTPVATVSLSVCESSFVLESKVQSQMPDSLADMLRTMGTCRWACRISWLVAASPPSNPRYGVLKKTTMEF